MLFQKNFMNRGNASGRGNNNSFGCNGSRQRMRMQDGFFCRLLGFGRNRYFDENVRVEPITEKEELIKQAEILKTQLRKIEEKLKEI